MARMPEAGVWETGPYTCRPGFAGLLGSVPVTELVTVVVRITGHGAQNPGYDSGSGFAPHTNIRMPILKVLDGAADIREGADGQIQSELQGCQGLAHLSPGGAAMECVQTATAIELAYSDITESWHFRPQQ